LQKKRAFFKEAVKNIKTSGTIVPSSKYLIKKMLKTVDFSNTKIVVEYGSGNGIITKEILKKLDKNGKLICFEINNEFYNHLLKINDSRLIVVNESSENINLVINKLNIIEVDCIISSLPLTNIPDQISINILKQSYLQLKKNGVFLQYQYSLTYFKKLKEIYKNVDLEFEIRNLPPAFIYICKKI